MSVKITVRKVGDVTVLDVEGQVTLEGGSSDLRQTIRELLGEGHTKLLLNLKEVSHIDSTGMGELVSAFAVAANQSGLLKLVNPTKRIRDLLQITKLYPVFEVYTNEAEAVRSFA